MGLQPSRSFAAAALAVGVMLTGCGGSPGDGGREAVRVKERDFRISAPQQIQAGSVRLEVHNDGPDAHELIVARPGHGRLPIGPDGLTVDEEKLEDREVAELEAGDPALRTLDLHLQPGRYVLLCNMSGHYKGGMHTELRVR